MQVNAGVIARELAAVVDRDAGKVLRPLILRLSYDPEEAEEIAAAPLASQVDFILNERGFGFDFFRELFGLPV